jgi:hypothetical protein
VARDVRNVALFFLGTAIVNEAVRLSFDDFELYALDRIFTGVGSSSRSSSPCLARVHPCGGKCG